MLSTSTCFAPPAGFVSRLQAFVEGLSPQQEQQAKVAETELIQYLQSAVRFFASHEQALFNSAEFNQEALSSALFGYFAETRTKTAFALFFEINQDDFLKVILNYLHGNTAEVNSSKVLEDVFAALFYEPERYLNLVEEGRFGFRSSKSLQRSQLHALIRATVNRHVRKLQEANAGTLRSAAFQSFANRQGNEISSEITELINPEEEISSRETSADANEQFHDTEELTRGWMLYLQAYLKAYRCLPPREKRALYLVEVKQQSYKQVALELRLTVSGLKVMLFRIRRKIQLVMKKQFQGDSQSLGQIANQESGETCESDRESSRSLQSDLRLNNRSPNSLM